ncbi:MAG TPA: ATP-binding protein [Bryobacteraceae bacterium]|nr:ATP-binding protein [Bryobacteraceae bacterium]
MQLVLETRKSSWASFGKLIASLLAVGAVTAACKYSGVNQTTTGFAYLLTVLFIASGWGFGYTVVASIVAMLCYNFFFLPPIGQFTITDPQNWIALGAFLVTGIVAGQLSASVKRQANAAIGRQLELERLYSLGRSILLDSVDQSVPSRLARHVAEAFELRAVTLFDLKTSRNYLAGPEDLAVPAGTLQRILAGDAEHPALPDSRCAVIRLGTKPAGVLAVRGIVSDTALDAISSLVAIGLERARTQEVESLAKAARQSEELKSTLLDAIAHEFKTPLTSIKAATTTVLAEDHLTGQDRELLSIVNEETDRLDNLVSDAIQMSRIEGGKFKLRRSVVSPNQVIETVIAQMRPRLEDRPVVTAVAPNVSGISIDRDLIQLSLRQLVDNALKHASGKSPIEVGADLGGSEVRFWVRDDGPGISAAEADRVFERFYRGRLNRHAVPGSGIGLSVVREIARAHGGDAFVESIPGEGSRFIIKVPLATDELR